LQRSLQANAEGRPALIHLKLDSEVSTNRSTLSAIRAAALRRQPG
jgi:acetolactate synthase-1/2/3 large subunit